MVSREGQSSPVTLEPCLTAYAYRLLAPPEASRVCLVLANVRISPPSMLLDVEHSSRMAFASAIRALFAPILAAKGLSPAPARLEPALSGIFRVRCRVCADRELVATVPALPAPPATRYRGPRLVREVPGVRPPRHVERGPPLAVFAPGSQRLTIVRPAPRAPPLDRTPIARVSAFPRVRRSRPDRDVCLPAVCSTVRPAARPRYIPRRLYLAGVRPPLTLTTSTDPLRGVDPLCGFNDATQIVFERPPVKTVDVWQAAQLFAACPGFFFYGSAAALPLTTVETCFRLALSKRCSTANTQRKVAGFASAFVSFANATQAPFVGRAAVFFLSAFLESLVVRGTSVPSLARWSIKVFGEILGLDIPIGHPAVTAVIAKANANPRPPKQGPMLELGRLLGLGKVASDKGKPTGMRMVAAGYLLMALASLRFSDTKAIFEFRKNETALRGRPRDLKRRGRPIIMWATPRTGFTGSHSWASVLLRSWQNDPPLTNGHRALFPFIGEEWAVHSERAASYNLVLKLFRRTCAQLGFEKPKWALRSARAWFPTCANQLGWSPDDRRKLGHWAPGSVMMEHYDRAVCTTELRLRGNILGGIRNDAWAPTPAFQVPAADPVAKGPCPDAETKPEPDTQSDVSDQTSLGMGVSETVFSEVDISDLFDTEAYT